MRKTSVATVDIVFAMNYNPDQESIMKNQGFREIIKK